jgi:putative ABC transport system permease protein
MFSEAGNNKSYGFWQDLRYGVRTLPRNPRFSLIAIITLALGIGTATAIFSILYEVLLRPLPYVHPEQLVAIWGYEARTANVPASGPDFLDWQKQNRVFSNMVAYSNYRDFNFGDESQPEHLRGSVVSPDFFRMLGMPPAVGRDFLPDEEKQTHSRVAVISHRFWKRRFAGQDVLGRTITLDTNAFTIVGVLPPKFWFPHMDDVDIWVPLNSAPANLGENATLDHRDSHWLKVIARLKPEVTLQQANDDMHRVAAELEHTYPTTNSGVGASVKSFYEDAVGNVQSVLWLLQGAVGLVFLVACLNVAGLLLARSIERQREVATRIILGAGRWRIAQQLFAETLVLCFFGGGLGVLTADIALRLFRVFQATGATIAAQGSTVIIGSGAMDLSRGAQANINGQVLLFVTLVVFLSACVCSLAPLFMVSRTSPIEGVASGGRFTAKRWVKTFRTTLVAGEVAMATVLLVGAVLLVKSLMHLNAASPGFVPQGAMAAQLQITGVKYATEEPRLAFYEQLLSRSRSQPGVTAAGLIDFLPFGGLHNNGPFLVKGSAASELWRGPLAEYRVVSADYFKTMQISTLAGRDFDSQDAENHPHTVIVSRNLADEFLGGARNAVGQHLRLAFAPDDWFEVVGVVGDVKHWNVGEQASRYVYFPITQWEVASMFVVVRSTPAGAEALAPSLRAVVAGIDGTQSIFDAKSLDDRRKESFGPYQMNLFALGTFACAALALACVGLYSIISFIVVQRTPEVGIRMALGAQRGQVLGLVLKQCLGVTVAGLGLGCVAALGTSRFLSHFLYGVSTSDPPTFAIAAGAIFLVAMCAGYFPARRATEIDAARALRHD